TTPGVVSLMTNAVISFGGSVFTEVLDDLDDRVDELRRFADEVDKLVVVVGAGALKSHINASSDKASQAELDLVGIQATRLNASVMKTYFDDVHPTIPTNLDDVVDAVEYSDLIIMGGTEPGHSTDAVAALAGELIDADVLVNVTDVDGIYDRDPDEGDAEKLDQITYAELLDMVAQKEVAAGSYALMDLTACKILDRSKIRTVIINGKKEGELLKALSGEHSGTEVVK
ncbi:MAG: UMP kinase, partial [Candidatus Nanohaloarchaea archaeon]|nr:UMP kinase [Candidatus Nanohaloarchaea archaeon]